MHHPLPPDDTLYDQVRPILWTGYFLKLLDQRKLPFVVEYVECHSSEDVTQAIRTLIVRGRRPLALLQGGAPSLQRVRLKRSMALKHCASEPALQRLHAARPTAVNLAWVLARMRRTPSAAHADWRQVMECEAESIAREDITANRRMGAYGAALIPIGSGVLTHCNTGSLATAGFGTALGVIRAGTPKGASHAYSQERPVPGYRVHVSPCGNCSKTGSTPP